MKDERDPPPMHFGDYPHGAYWSAERREQDDEGPEDYTVDGQVIRLMWDYGVRVPSWDAAGLLPEEPEWLRVELRASLLARARLRRGVPFRASLRGAPR